MLNASEAGLTIGDDVVIRMGTTRDDIILWSKKVYTIESISDHKPVDGPPREDTIAHMIGGHWEFIWCLKKVDIGEPEGNVVPIK